MSSSKADSRRPAPEAFAAPKLAEVSTANRDAQPASEGSPARRRFLPIAGGLLLCGALIVGGSAWHYQSTHVSTRNALVRSHLSELGVRGEGVIAQMFVKDGDRVEAGQLLARLDDRHLLAQREQIEAAIATLAARISVDEAALQLAREQSSVARSKAEAELRQRQAEAEAARVQAEDSRAFHAAREALQADGAISAEVIRDAAAKASMRAALASAASAVADGSYSELRAAELAEEEVALREGELRVLHARQQELGAQLQRVEADIASTRVTAPADGAVIRRLAQPGMAVNTGMPLLSLWLTDETWIEAWIPEEQLGRLQPGDPVSVRFPAMFDQRFEGHLERIGLATDFEMPLDYLPQTRESRMRPTPQVGVRIRLDVAPEFLRPGLSAVVDIESRGA